MTAALTLLGRADKERLCDEHAAAAEELLARGSKWADRYGPMAAAHATLAMYYQARIEWEHGVGY